VAFKLLELLTSKENCADVKKQMGFSWNQKKCGKFLATLKYLFKAYIF
jgi:hypothetical protein